MADLGINPEFAQKLELERLRREYFIRDWVESGKPYRINLGLGADVKTTKTTVEGWGTVMSVAAGLLFNELTDYRKIKTPHTLIVGGLGTESFATTVGEVEDLDLAAVAGLVRFREEFPNVEPIGVEVQALGILSTVWVYYEPANVTFTVSLTREAALTLRDHPDSPLPVIEALDEVLG